MADIVLGIGSSHGPLLSTPPEQWDLRAKADRENKGHWFRGKTYDYESLLRERAPGFANEVTVEIRRERFLQCRSALEKLGTKFNQVAPDALKFATARSMLANDRCTRQSRHRIASQRGSASAVMSAR